MSGLDISHWNGTKITEWKHIAYEHDFVMLKFGGEEGRKGILTRDKTFVENYYRAKEAGMHVGCYFFMSTKEEVIKDSPVYICEEFLNAIDNYDFDMPIVLDVEGQPKNLRKDNTKYVYDWCDIMEEHNYYVSIYGSDISTFKDILNISDLERFDKWVARYGKEPEYVKQYGMWQKSSSHTCFGITGKYDLDVAYINYPSVIRSKGLNR